MDSNNNHLFSHDYYKNNLNFEKWYNEYIYVDNGLEKIPRYLAIRIFCIDEHGLIPFVKKQKFYFKYSDIFIINNITLLMYNKYLGKKNYFIDEQGDYDEAHLDAFNNAFDSENCSSFWHQNDWHLIQDFNDENGGYAYRFRYEIFNYIWNWIDLDNSPLSIEINAELQERIENDEYNESLINTNVRKYDLY